MQLFALVVFTMVGLVCVCMLVGQAFEHFKIRFIHQSAIGIFLGWLIGLLIYLSYRSELSKLYFNQHMFFYGLLPPIIFAGGYNLRKSRFFQHFSYVLLYGLVSTLVMFLILLLGTSGFSHAGLITSYVYGNSAVSETIYLNAANCLLFAATVCASDSVAALTLIQQSYVKVFSIVFGQGMVNDAISIILFRSVAILSTTSFSPQMALQISWNFIYILVLSTIVGALIAFAGCLIFKHMRFLNQNSVAQVALVMGTGLLAYSLNQLFDLSGVIGVLVCGICLAHYNFYNLSAAGQVGTAGSLQALATLTQTFIFVYLGLNFWTMFEDSSGNQYYWSWSFLSFQLFLCSAARAISIYLLSLLCYLCGKSKWKLNIYQLNIIAYSGLIRGSVAYALILTIDDDSSSLHQQQILRSTVLFMVYFTTIVLGALMPFVVKYNINKSNLKRSQIEEVQMQMIEKPVVQNTAPEEKPQGIQQESKVKRFWSRIDQRFIKPCLIYKYEARKQMIQSYKQALKKQVEGSGKPFLKVLLQSLVRTSQLHQEPEITQPSPN